MQVINFDSTSCSPSSFPCDASAAFSVNEFATNDQISAYPLAMNRFVSSSTHTHRHIVHTDMRVPARFQQRYRSLPLLHTATD